MLGSRVAGAGGNGELALDAADKYDRSAVARTHRRKDGLRKENGTRVVGLEHLLLDLRRRLIVVGTDSETAADHRNVNRAEELLGFLRNYHHELTATFVFSTNSSSFSTSTRTMG